MAAVHRMRAFLALSAVAAMGAVQAADVAATDPVVIGKWQTWTPNAGVVPIHLLYTPGDKVRIELFLTWSRGESRFYMGERLHIYDSDPTIWTAAELATIGASQWYHGNPNLKGLPFFTDAAEWDGVAQKTTFINRNFVKDYTGQLHGYAFCSGHAQLANGSYLVAGGDQFWNKNWDGSAGNYTSNGRSDIRVYNPSTATTEAELTVVASMYRPPDMQPDQAGGNTYTYWGRWYPSLLALPTEEIMIIGGQHYFFNASDPNANAPSSGKVWMFAHSESAIVDPATGTETPHLVMDLTKENGLQPLSFPFAGTNFVPMLSFRDNYRMETWLCGGVNGTAPDGTPVPREYGGKDEWSNCPNCAPTSVCHWFTLEDQGATPAAVNLPDGTILIVSGSGQGHQGGVFGQPKASKGVKEPVIFNPSYARGNPKRWTVGAAAPTGRHYHNTALLREDGTVVTGGGDAQNGDDFANGRPDDMSLDLYWPPYKFIANPPKLVLPFLTAKATYGQQIVVRFTDAIANTIVSVSIIRYASMTHTVNLDQRHIELEILKYGKDKLLVQLPASANIAPPGNWMVWASDNRGAVVEHSGLINIRASNPNTPPVWEDADTIPTPAGVPVQNRDSRRPNVGSGAFRASIPEAAAATGLAAFVGLLFL
ncbi:uncharacterized protein EV422DRAFT_506378 [Fimicolochytrium jonesii]|uniref:uncharacterized protein n=1 Tax=Fimicolochytrium jonesii TaxID=1396493 RepID=UPI0022FE6B1B|nr:uncharacterized protein EV422DRAFT_506378 [Fimicolochytrium jonesii]KAI8821182.1 hypothetical protein EV422DRAFT_506378 [Fimicolochytrium jonesii]